MSSRHDASYCRFCSSPINWSCTPPIPVTLLPAAMANKQKRSAHVAADVEHDSGGAALLLLRRRHQYILAHHSRVRTQEIPAQAIFFVNVDMTKYVSVEFYPAHDYQTPVDFGAIRKSGSKCLILTDEQIDTLAGCLPAILDSKCVGGTQSSSSAGAAIFGYIRLGAMGRPDSLSARST